MKIVFILDSLSMTKTHKLLLDEVFFLRSQDIDASILTLSREDTNDTLYAPTIFTKESFASVPFNSWWKKSSWVLLRKVLEEKAPDLVITYGNRADVYGRISAWRAHIKNIFVFAHDTFDIESRNKNQESFLGFMATRYIVSREEGKNVLVSRGVPLKKISVLRDGISFSDFGKVSSIDIRRSFDITPLEFVFLYLGDITLDSGVDVLLRAFAKVNEGRLVVVGKGEELKNFRVLAEGLGIGTRVKFLEEYHDIAGLIMIAGATVLPAKKIAFAESLVWSLASGVPVIATDFEGVEEIVTSGENGLIVQKQDSEVLAEAMRVFLHNPKLYQSVRAHAKMNLSKFSLSSYAAKLLALV